MNKMLLFHLHYLENDKEEGDEIMDGTNSNMGHGRNNRSGRRTTKMIKMNKVKRQESDASHVSGASGASSRRDMTEVYMWQMIRLRIMTL